jgi:hypothetical protein
LHGRGGRNLGMAQQAGKQRMKLEGTQARKSMQAGMAEQAVSQCRAVRHEGQGRACRHGRAGSQAFKARQVCRNACQNTQ